jgi:hypothetical protein
MRPAAASEIEHLSELVIGILTRECRCICGENGEFSTEAPRGLKFEVRRSVQHLGQSARLLHVPAPHLMM